MGGYLERVTSGPLDTEEVVDWLGIGADGAVRLGGEDTDWSGGWRGQTEDGVLVRVQ